LIVIDDQVDAVREDVAPDRREEKTNKVVDSKYLQSRWCPHRSRSLNGYGLRRCGKRSERSVAMNYSMKSSP
jgi:hypothetical protein